jgi:hypothetical protein
MPDTFAVGQPTSITVFTYGHSCYSRGSTEVSLMQRVATIEPYDTLWHRAVCLLRGETFEHQASVTFATAGSSKVRIIGLCGWPPWDSTLVREYPVLVR